MNSKDSATHPMIQLRAEARAMGFDSVAGYILARVEVKTKLWRKGIAFEKGASLQELRDLLEEAEG